MDMLLKEMQDMDKFVQKPVAAPSVINEVAKLQNPDQMWSSAPKNDESLAEVRTARLSLHWMLFNGFRCSFGRTLWYSQNKMQTSVLNKTHQTFGASTRP